MSNDAPCRKQRNVHHTSTEDIVEMLSLQRTRSSNANVQRAACNTVATWQPNRMQAQRQRTTIPPRTRAVTPARANLHARSRTYTRTLTHMLSTRSLTHTEGTPTLGSAAVLLLALHGAGAMSRRGRVRH
jgi:hypothetical protein